VMGASQTEEDLPSSSGLDFMPALTFKASWSPVMSENKLVRAAHEAPLTGEQKYRAANA
jgi:hypothetical protein